MTNEDPIMDNEQVGEAVARYLEGNPELLDGSAPSRDLWPAIENRISARVLPIERKRAGSEIRRHPLGWLLVLAAASALVASSAGITYVLSSRGSEHAVAALPNTTPAPSAASVPARSVPDSTAAATAAQLARSEADSNEVAAPTRVPESEHVRRATSSLASRVATKTGDDLRSTYDSEIATLHTALEARRGQLNPATVAVIEENLRVINEAIRQSKAALAKDPNSRLLNDQLDRTLATKTGLLRAAALLPAA